MTGTTRTTTSLILKKLKNNKAIDYKHGRLIILDKQKIRDEKTANME
jgi:hypothetical protein